MARKDILIRDIDAAVKERLSQLAAKSDTSVNNLCKIILTDYALHPSVRNLDNRYENLVKDVVSMYSAQNEELKALLEESNATLNKAISLMVELKEDA